ncbi:metalloregulator ArsR/SmtB family transcription factor [Streptomyces sp. SL13]|uniref:Metalloregulator ArsR/SmtB family transcription factor n=1 Tax=Streptantibioticus silvisoli TaxID=2705255 RepID=A0AA90K998_9ACTN|nr:metalloregulator ArsR/SmtB family transcription factor [Streptantibioticus silvisoli]MDI5970888.1 metalloregulator ArsR/SmtB family transcription factor [Streptantibioticus silvisoli]
MRTPLHPPIEDVGLAGVLSALGDPVRLRIVQVLADGEEHLRPDFDVPVGQSTLSHHMKTLRDAGVVLSRPEGTRCFVSLRPELEQRFPGLVAAVLRNLEDATGPAADH